MKNLISGMVLAVILMGLYATAQQPHVTTTLPSATVKLNGASGGGSGTGFDCDLEDEECVFAPVYAEPQIRLVADTIRLWGGATRIASQDGETSYFSCDAADGCVAAQRLQLGGVLTSPGAAQATSGALVGNTMTVCDSTSGNVTMTLPANTGYDAQEVWVYNVAGVANSCVIAAPSGLALDGTTDGTITMADGEVRRLLKVDYLGNWRTMAVYPVTGTLSGLTATKLPVATSATAVGDSAITHVSATGDTVFAGSAPKIKLGSDVKNHISPHVSDQGIVVAGATYIVFKLADTQIGYIGTDTYLQTLHLPSVDVDHMQVGVATVDGPSKALVDATATAFTRIGVSSGGYNGGVLVYSVFATDGTDIQTRSGSVAFSIINSGGTETCAFGTPNDVPNVTSGTLSVSFDCAAGTNTVDFRATADTSLASTTIFTIRARPDIPSGTPAVTPQ